MGRHAGNSWQEGEKLGSLSHKWMRRALYNSSDDAARVAVRLKKKNRKGVKWGGKNCAVMRVAYAQQKPKYQSLLSIGLGPLFRLCYIIAYDSLILLKLNSAVRTSRFCFEGS